MATPPRSNFYETVFDLVPTSATFGKPISTGITVTVYIAQPYAAAALTSLANVYTAETGATSPGNPFNLPMTSGGAGEINIWLGAGSYDIRVSDSTTPKRFADRVVRWDSDPGDKGTTNSMLDDATLAATLGINNPNTPTVRRGKTIIAATETTSSTSYTLLTTPDRVQNVKLEQDGIIWVMASFNMVNSGGSAQGKMGLFLGNNQVQGANGTSALSNVEVPSAAVNVQRAYATEPTNGTTSQWNGFAQAGTPVTDVTTGQMFGSAMAGWVPIFAAAGTYDVSLRALALSGITTVWNRKLYVKTEAF